ncbi:MAG: nucleotidyl transferase AbiEii/AbiGii toxin family protein [Anaerolineae bacterium]|nr:nucleotidyl transferase AbiEii/AbiGii toxin family protein [Anaerolineae bacterium]
MNQNIAASVHQRLLNCARSSQRPFTELLNYFALERFLYRLGCSRFRDQLVLKGALMFTVWESPFPRTTRDIDLLARLDNSIENIVSVVREICLQNVPIDGMRFAEGTIAGERILQGIDYEGVRVRFTAFLGKSRIPMQIDVGFGDHVIPAPVPVDIPTLLDFPSPKIQGYSRESAIAEKLQSMVRLGEINSRMKDFFDIWLLAESSHFAGAVLQQAIQETFLQRRTPVVKVPIAFTRAYTGNPDKLVQWTAFLRRNNMGGDSDIPSTLSVVVDSIAAFLQPVLTAVVQGEDFHHYWHPGGPWVTE